MKPAKITRTQLDCLTALELRATNGVPWSDRFDIPGVPFSTPTFDALARRGFADRYSHRNAWGWFEWSYSITAAGAAHIGGLAR